MVQYDETFGCYIQTINTSSLIASSAPYTVEFTFNKDHYDDSQVKELQFYVNKRLTLISGSSINKELYPVIYVQDSMIFNFTYTDKDFATNILDLDSQSYTITKTP